MKRSSERLTLLLRRLNPSPGYRQRETAGQTKPVFPATDRPEVALASVVAEGHEDPQDIPEQQRHPGKQGQGGGHVLIGSVVVDDV